MVNVFYSCSMLELPEESYPESALTDAVEQAINASLPELPGLHSALTERERLAAFEKNVTSSFVRFTLLYSDPFGCYDHAPPVETVGKHSLPMGGEKVRQVAIAL